MSIEHRFS